MHHLRAIALELPGMDGLIEAAMQNQWVQMITVDLNPLWRAAHVMEDAGLDPESAGWWRWEQLASPASLAAPRWDLNRRYKHVQDAFRHMFGNEHRETWLAEDYQPYLARIVLRPELCGDSPDNLDDIAKVARQTPFATLIETRAEPKPLLGPGDSCLNPSPGVIGGFLRDKNNGAEFGATCGHVASHNDVLYDRANVTMGTCTSYSHNPFTSAAAGSGTVCRPGSPGVQRVDLALISPPSKTPANLATSIEANVQMGDPIELHADGGKKRYEVGGVVLTASIKGTCFDRLYEVRARPHWLLHPRLGAVFARMPKPGHSGAWILKDGTKKWCGVLIAGEPSMAYALESDDLLTEADNIFNTQLELA